jgi:two-component system, NtrC family, sensor kinase
MKKKILFWVLYFFFLNQSFGQTSLPPVYEIKSDTAKSQLLDVSFWQKLEDKESKWNLEDVSRLPLSSKFHANGLKTAGIDTNEIHTYWYRYRLKNKMLYPAKISLSSLSSYFDVFIRKHDSLFAQYQTGYDREWDKKDGLKSAGSSGAINFILQPEEEIEIYERLNRKWETNYNSVIRLWDTDKLVKEKYIDYVDSRMNYFGKTHLQEAFVLGLLLLTIFLNIFFYRIVREKVYLYFALFALFLSVNRLWNISNQYARWENPGLMEFVPLLGYAWAFIPYFLVQFFRYFLKLKLTHPRWDRFLLSLAIINILMNAVSFLTIIFFKPASSVLFRIIPLFAFLLIPLCIIITLLLYVRKNERSIRYVITGSFPLLLLYLMSVFSDIFPMLVIKEFRLIEVISISWFVLSFSLILLMRFDLLRKENAQQALDKERVAREKELERTLLIEQQKIVLEKQVEERTAALTSSLDNLKDTQSQLIQSEKMASLGELTAGIAHEIQNPLNFVNNFSEVNKELLTEMKDEIEKGNYDDAKDIADDVIGNEEKINQHGKRADAIVKGMLQHSRRRSGVKEPTDINKLTDEYLRLAYHGIRAKDNSFNATLKTDYDEKIGSINIVPQDIGRVILNLITNAFYAVAEKKKAQPDYEPIVTVSTMGTPSFGEGRDEVKIMVKDNGNGIPQKVLDKIFQPFFTTKPTGQGTGLGLSLSYDIVKAHGGEIKVESKEGEGAAFIVGIPA